ncbi:MAG TPA: DNA polymerase III subunit delta [Chitinophagaceae bacterium]|nr:DNA polymerase III subunit delta [Chitinophagaceae bacterium]
MAEEKILNDWKKKQYKPVYWLEGEEEYYIDKLVHYAEHHILSGAEAGFNLTIFYGKDATWAEVINACRRYPMFSDKQVVLLKEAQHMKELDKLTAYIDQPLASTIFIVGHKEKKVDGKTKFAKLIKQKAEYFLSEKIKDYKLTDWISNLVYTKGLNMSPKAVALLADHIGNDLSRIENEIEKIQLNIGERKTISEDDIEKYVGISKEYNVFELQDAFGKKDLARAIRIIQYFESNPKAAPIQLTLPSLYSFFSKVYMIFGTAAQDDKSIAAAVGVSPWFVKDYIAASRKYGYEGTERALLLLHKYNLKSVGVNDSGTEDASLLKELAAKVMM